MLKCEHQISQSELLDVQALLERCRKADGNAIPIYPNLLTQLRALPSNVLYYEGEQLVGFLSVYFFYEDKCELVVLVDPAFRRRHIASQLFAMIVPVIQQRNLQQVLCSVPSGPDYTWLKARGFEKVNTECRMQFMGALPSLPLPKGVSFSRATHADVPTIIELNRDCFLNHSQYINARFSGLIDDPEYILFLLHRDKEIVGKAHLYLGVDHVCLSDIAIFKKFQGQGLGTLLVAYCVLHLQKTGAFPIVLDVEQKNFAALRVYHKLGFKVLNTWDYWLGRIDPVD